MPFSLAQGRMMDDSMRTAACRRTKSGSDEDVRVGSLWQKGRLVYLSQWEYHWKTQQGMLDENIRHLMSLCFPCWIVKASREEQGPARAVQDAQNFQI